MLLNSMRTHRRHVLTAFATACAAVSLAVPPSASAATMTFVVDTVSDNSADGVTLRDAIADANANPGSDGIKFADGLAGTITLTGGELTVTDDLRVFGPGRDVLTIDANNASRIFNSVTPGVSLDLKGMHLTNGSTLGLGGAVLSNNGDKVTLRELRVSNNRALDGGGALIQSPAGSALILDVEFIDNTATAGAGGGLYVFAPAGTDGVQVSRSSFNGNTALTGPGGAAYVSAATRQVTIYFNDVVDNTAPANDAGGMFVDGDSVSLFGGTFINNSAGGNHGALDVVSQTLDTQVRAVEFRGNTAFSRGAGRITSGGAVEVRGTTVTDNTAEIIAGFEITAVTNVDITDSVFDGNVATFGTGALIVHDATSFNMTGSTVHANEGPTAAGVSIVDVTNSKIERSTVSANRTTSQLGGGIYLDGGGVDKLVVNSSTISGNTAAVGGAIASVGVDVDVNYSTIVNNAATVSAGGIHMDNAAIDLRLNHSILAENTAPSSPDTNESFHLDDSILGSGVGLVLTGERFVVGVDPELGPLADNGGPTLTHLPQAGSPAIDGGNPLQIFLGIFTDQRGRIRPSAPVDIGSVEVADDVTSVWVPVTPARIVDTRSGQTTIDGTNEGEGTIAAGDEIKIDVAGRAGIPADAIGVVANLTAVNPAGTGFLTSHPCLASLPLSASLNYTAGVNLGNEIIIGLDAGSLCVFSSNQTHLTIDVVGYIPADSPYEPIAPTRYLDTRPGGTTFDGAAAGEGAPGAGEQLMLDVTGRGVVPVGVEAVVAYVTAIGPTSTGFVTLYSCDTMQPLASSLNHVAGVNRGNEVIINPGFDGVCIYTDKNVHLTVDVVGYIEGGTNFTGFDEPGRLLDTRATGTTIDGLFQAGGRLDAGDTLMLDVAGRGDVPLGATTVSMNLTAVGPTSVGFITAFPCGGIPPLAASVNFVPGINGGNEIVASLDDSGRVCLFTSAAVHLAVDATGATSS